MRLQLQTAVICGLLLLPAASVHAQISDSLRGNEDRALMLIDAADREMQAGHKQTALKYFLEALELEPADATALYGVAAMSFDVGRYGDAAWAYAARNKVKPLSAGSRLRYALSLMVLGDYPGAYTLLETMTDDDSHRSWRIVAAYGKGGWSAAVAAWQQAPSQRFLRDNDNVPHYAMGNVVIGGIRDMKRRAEEGGLRYAQLTHTSLLYSIYDDIVVRHAGSSLTTVDKSIHADHWNLQWEVIDLYRTLPLKPVPPGTAVEAAARGDVELAAGRREAAVKHYAQALRIAPWWPEAHYDMSLLAQYGDVMINDMAYEKGYSQTWEVAVQELIFYLKLAPDGKYAAEAKKALKERKQPWPD